ncbi:MAG: PLDc N-terminal domain-containing protein [Saprospiraceae bacterium]|nr:PLDc N-terminal domain-containing protein [Saprospiraceae bacterium]
MEILVLIFLFTIGMGLVAVWFFSLLDIIRSDFTGQHDKLIWLLVIILIPFIGTILYLTIGRAQKNVHQGTEIV